MIGIGGISMSALALMIKDRGIVVKGSDARLSDVTKVLSANGIDIVEGYAPQFVKECDAIVYTGAVSQNNKDLILARKICKKIYTRSQILGFLSEEKKTISIAGTHGKTTTTGMTSTILLEDGADPTIHIGGKLKTLNSNVHIGKSDLFITEACEYQDAFLTLKSCISVILNIEEEHLDYFKNFDNICNSFNNLVKNTLKNGIIVYNFDNCKNILKINDRKSVSFGLTKGADLQAINIEEYLRGRYSFDACFNGQNIGNFKLSCIGKHNIYNALATIAVCYSLGLSVEVIRKGLVNFKGIERRMDIIKESPLIIHDYAHHPQEIEASLKSIRSFTDKKLICIFQPHTFSRTKTLYNQFLTCFDLCDEVWLLPIYPAREKAIRGVTSRNLQNDLLERGVISRYFSTFETCQKEISKKQNQNLAFAILGAGDIVKLANMFSD